MSIHARQKRERGTQIASGGEETAMSLQSITSSATLFPVCIAMIRILKLELDEAEW